MILHCYRWTGRCNQWVRVWPSPSTGAGMLWNLKEGRHFLWAWVWPNPNVLDLLSLMQADACEAHVMVFRGWEVQQGARKEEQGLGQGISIPRDPREIACWRGRSWDLLFLCWGPKGGGRHIGPRGSIMRLWCPRERRGSLSKGQS